MTSGWTIFIQNCFIQWCSVAAHFCQAFLFLLRLKSPNSPASKNYYTDQLCCSQSTLKANFHQNTNISLCCLICIELPSPFFSPLCHSCCTGCKERPKQHPFQGQGKGHYIVLLALIFPIPWKWSPRSFLTNPPSSLVSSYIYTIQVCTVFSQRNYPSSVHLVRSLLSTWIMDVPLQTDTTPNPCSPPVQW